MKILVTGCSSGLGKELVRGSEHEFFEHYRKLINPKTNQLVGDINSPNFRQDFSKFLSKNSINVFVNNAGVYMKSNLIEHKDEDLELIFKTNLLSPIFLTKIAVEHFKNIGGGLIVNINSLAGKNGTPGEAIYSASKFGLRGFSNSIRYEVKDLKIEILDIYLGAMQTRMTRHRENYESLIHPREVAEVILKLVDDYKSLNITELEIRKK